MTRDYGWYRSTYSDVSTGLAAGPLVANPSTLATARNSSTQIFVQKITVNVGVYAAETWTLQDSADAPVKIAVATIPAAASALPSENGAYVYDFGAQGIPLTQGKNLVLSRSDANAVGSVSVEAYSRPIGPVTPANA